MLSTVGQFAIRRRRPILAVAVLFLLLAAVFGGTVSQHLSANGGFNDPSSASTRADAALATLGEGSPQLVLVVTPSAGPVSSAAGVAQGRAFAANLATLIGSHFGQSAAHSVASYWSTGEPAALASTDGRRALIVARLATTDDQAVKNLAVLNHSITALAARDGVSEVETGRAAVFGEVSDSIERDLIRAESFAIPITAVLLILVFGSGIAALMPLALGLLSLLGSFLVLRLLVLVTPVSVYSTNLATSLGLGLGIDYGLFILTRYREELAAGAEPHDAIVGAVGTAGRTVLFSATTVAAALAALLVFPLYFLRSFAYAGVAATMLAAVASLLVLPALIATLGTRLNSYDLRKPLRRALRMSPPPAAGIGPETGGMWHRIATFVMRRPVLLGGTVVVVLIVVGLPFARVSFGLPDDRVLPSTAQAAVGGNLLRTSFPTDTSEGAYVTGLGAHPSATALAAYATTLSLVPGVDQVGAATGIYEHGHAVAGPGAGTAQFNTPAGTWLSVSPSVEPYSPAGERLARDIRAVPAPFAHALVGGASAQLVDSEAAIGNRLPIAAAIIVATTLIVLFLFTGSVLLPIKAVVMTLLSLSATFGLMVWGFQEGHLSHLLHFTVTGTLDTTTPVLMFCLVFGLSMDYEVFLLSRIREEYLATGDNAHAVAWGLERTGRIVTAAAGLLAIVFLAFITSSITFIKLLGLGCAFAILVDATLVRGVLVPAFMRLMGDANWWAPGWLRRVHNKIGVSETGRHDEGVPHPELIRA